MIIPPSYNLDMVIFQHLDIPFNSISENFNLIHSVRASDFDFLHKVLSMLFTHRWMQTAANLLTLKYLHGALGEPSIL